MEDDKNKEMTWEMRQELYCIIEWEKEREDAKKKESERKIEMEDERTGKWKDEIENEKVTERG